MEYIDDFNKGKEMARELWEERRPATTDDCICLYDDLIEKASDLLKKDEVEFDEYVANDDGINSYIFEKELEKLDTDKFNESLKSLEQSLTEYEDCLFYIEELLPKLSDDEYAEGRGPAIEIPNDLRPTIFYDWGEIYGKIGRIYWMEEGMHSWYPCCDIFSEKSPDEVLETGCGLFYAHLQVSELLSAIQSVIDPEHKNSELSEMILRSSTLENKRLEELYNFLYGNGLSVICMQETWSPLRDIDSGDYICRLSLTKDGSIYMRLGILRHEQHVKGCYYKKMESSPSNYSNIINSVKESIEAAKGNA